MDFFHGITALLAFVVLILTALVAWMYVQQTRLMQAVSALTTAITAPPVSFFEAAKQYPVHEEESLPEQAEHPEQADDRVSVHEDELPTVTEAEEDADDGDLSDKKVSDLRSLLTDKGIPFNKSDKKGVLLTLLKAASN
jgi:hypothetical protein